MPFTNRENNFSKFCDWLKSKGVDTSSVEVAPFDDVGYGLKATRDLKVIVRSTSRLLIRRSLKHLHTLCKGGHFIRNVFAAIN